MPVDTNQLFDNMTDIRTTFRGRVLIHSFEFPERKAWLEYLRRSSNFQARNRKVVATDEALSARLWVYEHWCKKVEVEDGDTKVPVEDFQKKVPLLVQEQAATAFLSQVEVDQAEEKNS